MTGITEVAAQIGERHPHGTRTRYLGARCRCSPCRTANTQYERLRARARKAGDWNGLVSSEPARLHIRELARRRVGYKQVAIAAQVGNQTVYGVRAGRIPRIRARTLRKILAVTPSCVADHQLIPARRTWTMLRQILAEGYSRAAVARLLGYKTPALQINTRKVLAATEARVRRLYSRVMV